MREAVIVEALRTPIGRGKPIKGELSAFHATQLLAKAMDGVIEKAGIDPTLVEQTFGGCVTQAGEQSGNVTRNAWLSRGKGYGAGGTTVDTQCGSGMQSNHIVSALIKAGSIDVGIACGIELMSHVRLGANVINGPGFFQPADWPWDSTPDQFSSIDAPVLGEDGQPTGETRLAENDQGIRESTLEGLAKLKPVTEGGIHTAGTSSQISDGAAALLWMSAEKAKELGLRPRARILQDVVVGTDPYYLLDGPIDATNEILRKTRPSRAWCSRG
jgi:acetyl-CoA C-acetyltransferase